MKKTVLLSFAMLMYGCHDDKMSMDDGKPQSQPTGVNGEATPPPQAEVREMEEESFSEPVMAKKQEGRVAKARKGMKRPKISAGAAQKVMAPPVPKPTRAAIPRSRKPVDDDVPVTKPITKNTEEYTDYGINPFVETSKDNLSTFSVDVDTASYTIARRKLNDGMLPPFAAVRVEEYINYFNYDYDASKAKPFDVHLETMKDPFRKGQHIFRVGVQGKKLSVKERPSLRLTFLVDVSGSMNSPDKLPLATQAMHLLVDSLRDDDSVALATYAGRVEKILEPTYGDNKKAIHAAIDRLQSGGGTAMSSGLEMAYDMAWKSFKQGAENRVVVLSDGDANVGKTSWQDMLKQIKGYADRGVTMSTIGLGMGNYKDSRMEQLANKGDGNNHYIDSFAEAKRLFVDGFNGTMITIARDVKIQVDFNPKLVKSYRLLGYENRDIADKDFRNDRVDAGEVGAGHNVTALYGVVLQDGAQKLSSKDMATVRLRYEKPGADKKATERAWTYRIENIASADKASPGLRLAYTAGTFAEILRRSPHVVGLSLDKLIDYGDDARRRANKDDLELLSMMRKAKSLGAGGFISRK